MKSPQSPKIKKNEVVKVQNYKISTHVKLIDCARGVQPVNCDLLVDHQIPSSQLQAIFLHL